MPLKRAQLAIFEASAKIFRTDRKTPTCPTTMRVWTFGRIESRAQQLERGASGLPPVLAARPQTEKLVEDAFEAAGTCTTPENSP
jgi:hypothetical protein